MRCALRVGILGLAISTGCVDDHVPNGGEVGSGEPHTSSTADPACVPLAFPEKLELALRDQTRSSLPCDDSRSDVDACAGEGDLIAFVHDSKNLKFWINFEPALVEQGYSEESLHANFRWLWYSVKFPHPGTPEQPLISARIYVRSLDELDRFELSDGRLRIALHSKIEQLYRWVEPEGSCFDTDVGPYVCACDYPASLAFRLSLDAIFPP